MTPLENEPLVSVAGRIPKRMRELILRAVQLGAYKNISDFIVDAARSKLKTDFPSLFAEMVEGDQKKSEGGPQ